MTAWVLKVSNLVFYAWVLKVSNLVFYAWVLKVSNLVFYAWVLKVSNLVFYAWVLKVSNLVFYAWVLKVSNLVFYAWVLKVSNLVFYAWVLKVSNLVFYAWVLKVSNLVFYTQSEFNNKIQTHQRLKRALLICPNKQYSFINFNLFCVRIKSVKTLTPGMTSDDWSRPPSQAHSAPMCASPSCHIDNLYSNTVCLKLGK